VGLASGVDPASVDLNDADVACSCVGSFPFPEPQGYCFRTAEGG
jgi:hypothetical protein